VPGLVSPRPHGAHSFSRKDTELTEEKRQPLTVEDAEDGKERRKQQLVQGAGLDSESRILNPGIPRTLRARGCRRAQYLRRAHRERTQPLAHDVRHSRDINGEHQLNIPRDHIDQRRPAALVRHVRHRQAGLDAEELAGEMVEPADAGTAEAHAFRAASWPIR